MKRGAVGLATVHRGSYLNTLSEILQWDLWLLEAGVDPPKHLAVLLDKLDVFSVVLT